MAGPIGLQGGLEHYEPALPIDRRMLDEVGVFAPEVVILPFASFKSQTVSAGCPRPGSIGPGWGPGLGSSSPATEAMTGRWRWFVAPT